MSNTPIHIPLVDLAWQTAEVAKEVLVGFDEVIDRTAFILGPQVAAFEDAYAAYCGVQHCVGVANGTDAVELALRAAGVGRGHEVIVPANTFVATLEAVVRAGATPVIADCNEYFLLDPADAAAKRTSRTRAVIPVHLFGQMAAMDELREAMGPEILLVEDAAQSQGATQAGRRSGSIGEVAATSFYPGKNLGAYGDAGAVTSNDEQIIGQLKALRNHGGTNRYEHRVFGMNSRLDSLQAVVLSAKLDRLDEWNELRRTAATAYETLLNGTHLVQTPAIAPGNEHVWHLYVVRVPDRDQVLSELAQAGVQAGIHYPTPVHLLPAFAHLGYRSGDFPEAERASREILSLPMYPGLSLVQQERVVEQLNKAVDR